MQHYTNSVIAFNGDRVANATITVTDLFGNAVTIYQDFAGTTPLTSTTTNNNGEFDFYVPAGRYNISASGAGISGYTINDEFIGVAGSFGPPYTTERQIATASQTVFTLANAYTPGTNTITVFVNGLLMTYLVDYVETSSNVITFTSGLTVGDEVIFNTWRTTQLVTVDSANAAYLAAGSGAVSRTSQDKMRDFVSVKDFGAIGDGVTDDTVAIQNAINTVSTNASGNIYFPAGTYLVTSGLVANRQYISIYGDGVSSATILYHPSTTGGVLFTLSNTVSDAKAFYFNNITISTDVVSVGTAVKIQVNLTAASTQVNGGYDSLYFNNTRIAQSGIGYWTTGFHSLNNGGVHFNGLTINNLWPAAQTNTSTVGVFLECNDSRVNMIRTFIGSDLYVLRAYNSIKCETVVTTPSPTHIESIYISNAEFVGIGNAALKIAAGGVAAVSFNSVHVDTTNKAIDAESAYLAIARFVNCDFRKSANGASVIAGPLNVLDCGQMIQFSNSSFGGYNSAVSDTTNLVFKFTNTGPLAAYTSRFISDGNIFVDFYRVYGETFALTNGACTSNTYSYIADVVYSDVPLDTGVSNYDAAISSSVVVALSASGTFTVNVSLTGNYFTTQYLIAFLQQASPSGSDVLSVYYDSAASTSSTAVFKGTGNATFSGNVRFSFFAIPSIMFVTRT